MNGLSNIKINLKKVSPDGYGYGRELSKEDRLKREFF